MQNYLIIGGIAQNEFDEKDISYNDDDDIYLYYQELENMVYEKFITVEDGFFE